MLTGTIKTILFTGKLNVISQNVRGLADRKKRKQVFNVIKRHNAHTVMLQKSHSTGNMEKILSTEWGSKIYFSHGTSGSRGVAILFNKKLQPKILNISRDKKGRILILDFEINETKYTICNVYAPNEDKPEFFIHVVNLLKEDDNSNLIPAGDFNMVMDVNKEINGSTTNHENSIKILKTYIEEFMLVDILRHFHPDKFQFSWYRLNPKPVFCRLDMIIVDYGLSGMVDSADMLPGYKSDHSVLQVSLEQEKYPRGQGSWKLNASHLKEKDYVDRINQTISLNVKKVEKSMLNPAERWETIKVELIEVTEMV